MDSRKLVLFIVEQLVGQNNSILRRTGENRWMIQHGSIQGFNTSQVFEDRDDAIETLTDYLLSQASRAQGFQPAESPSRLARKVG